MRVSIAYFLFFKMTEWHSKETKLNSLTDQNKRRGLHNRAPLEGGLVKLESGPKLHQWSVATVCSQSC